MANETEHRFLLFSLPDLNGLEKYDIVQGYLSKDLDRTVRVRIKGEEGFLTVKGRKQGASAPEFEYPVPLDDARGLMALCPPGDVLAKTRYIRPEGDTLKWEIDLFKGALQGLYIAELEVPSEDTAWSRPQWMNGVNITHDHRFSNAVLANTGAAQIKALIQSYVQAAAQAAPGTACRPS